MEVGRGSGMLPSPGTPVQSWTPSLDLQGHGPQPCLASFGLGEEEGSTAWPDTSRTVGLLTPARSSSGHQGRAWGLAWGHSFVLAGSPAHGRIGTRLPWTGAGGISQASPL